FYSRWKEWESWYSQSFGLHFSLREEQWQEDWAFILSLASQPGSSLEQTHIFVLAHILRRPIIVYGVKYYKSFRGETLGYTRFQGEQPVVSDPMLICTHIDPVMFFPAMSHSCGCGRARLAF
ncbi:Ubiquitin thioesterase Zranb1, partial [Xenoophorus captivus]